MKAKKEKAKQEPIKIDYENKRLSTVYFMPLLLIAGFVPLIVYAKYIDLAGTTQSLYWTGQQQYLDFFSYWKSRWVIVLTLIGLIFYIILYIQKKLPFKNLKQYYIPLGIYAVFVIISTIFAKDTQTALWGFVDMYQGMFVLLSYVLITFLTINFVNNERDVNLFVNAFLFLMIVEGIIGITQYFGFDFFQTTIGKSLIVPGDIKVDGLSFSFGPKTIYGTLFNTNYVGSFATLMLPMAGAILLGTKRKKQKIVAAITVGLMLFVWIGCNSRAGYLGVAVSSIVALWLFRKVIKKYWKDFVKLVLLLIFIFVGLNGVSNGALLNRIKSLNIANEIETIKYKNENGYLLEDIIIEGKTVSFRTSTEVLNLKLENNKLFFMDENNKELEITTDGNEITINNGIYGGYRITIPDNYPGFTISRWGNWNWMTINFYVADNEIKILGSGNRITEPNVAPYAKFLVGYESMATGRGYIWSRTIPMITKYLISGSGPDNYTIAFPQDDFIAKVNSGMAANTVVDKPHNMYFQIAINSGMISLFSLIAIWGMYIVSCLKLYSKINFDSSEKFVGAFCLISIIGYLVTGTFNDYIISVSPLFWIILGLGISINYKLTKITK